MVMTCSLLLFIDTILFRKSFVALRRRNSLRFGEEERKKKVSSSKNPGATRVAVRARSDARWPVRDDMHASDASAHGHGRTYRRESCGFWLSASVAFDNEGVSSFA